MKATASAVTLTVNTSDYNDDDVDDFQNAKSTAKTLIIIVLSPI